MWRAGILNPWAGTGASRTTDPRDPDKDVIRERNRERLNVAVTALLGEDDNCLLLWFPLRRNVHLDGGQLSPIRAGRTLPESQELCSGFSCSTPASLLLARSGHLRTIDMERAASSEGLRDSVNLMRVA